MSDRTRLHLKLREYSRTALKKAKLGNVELDAFIVSTTPYDELRRKYGHDDGTPWTREEFTAAHILFFDGEKDSDCIGELFRKPAAKAALPSLHSES